MSECSKSLISYHMSNTTDSSSSFEAHLNCLRFPDTYSWKGEFTSQFVITILLLIKSRSHDIAEKLLKVTIKISTILKTDFILHVYNKLCNMPTLSSNLNMSVTSITASVLIGRKVFCHLIQKHIFRIELLMLDLIFAWLSYTCSFCGVLGAFSCLSQICNQSSQ
jgi:dimeric dUTPase (all-alpha-NTP-PPase superfamily)